MTAYLELADYLLMVLPRPGTSFGDAVYTPPMAFVNLAMVLGVVLAAALLFLVVRRWLRRSVEPNMSVELDQTDFVRPAKVRMPPPAARRMRELPGAAGAYLAALRELGAHDSSWARKPGETPRQHARRLRASPLSSVRWLAADYQLVQYGGELLNQAEERRASRRLASIRSILRTTAE